MSPLGGEWGGDAPPIDRPSSPGPPRVTAGTGNAAPRAVASGWDEARGGSPVRLGGRWSRSPNVVDRPTLLGVMVLPPEGAAVVLTGMAARVWEALAAPTGGDQLAERLGAGRAGAAGDGPALDQVAAALRYLQVMGVVREMR